MENDKSQDSMNERSYLCENVFYKVLECENIDLNLVVPFSLNVEGLDVSQEELV